jgi:hypothetical protein
MESETDVKKYQEIRKQKRTDNGCRWRTEKYRRQTKSQYAQALSSSYDNEHWDDANVNVKMTSRNDNQLIQK